MVDKVSTDIMNVSCILSFFFATCIFCWKFFCFLQRIRHRPSWWCANEPWFVKYPSVLFCWLLCCVSRAHSVCIHRFHCISRARRTETCPSPALCDQLTGTSMPSRGVLLRRHWSTDAPIVPASLNQRQAWIVIADIPRLKALHALTPKTASPCHLQDEPTLHRRFFGNMIP